MLRKVFKTILVLSLCVGISLPTNAAVSVSDGSAFVTKAEFAADLNNLSNRMAQLENSLDAKIDSLVSSYLTRNGIWNGQGQPLASSDTYVWYRDDGIYTVASSATSLSYNNAAAGKSENANFYKVALGKEWAYKPLTAASLNKTGLLCVESILETMQGMPIWAWINEEWSDIVKVWYEEVGIIIYNQPTLPTDFDFQNNLLYTEVIRNDVLTPNWYSTNKNYAFPIRFMNKILKKQWYAFVNKGDYLWLYYRFNPRVGRGLYVRYDTRDNYYMLKIDVLRCDIY